MQITRRGLASLLASFGLAAATKAKAQAKTVEVVMQNDTMPVFAPKDVQIKLGDTVHWVNKGVLVHTVTFNPKEAIKAADVVLPAGAKPFGSKDMNQDETYSHKFTTKGTYKYVCKYHEEMGMVGTVTVS